ncbi:MAG: cold shock domain-containing protein [Gallionella sp.]
MQNLASLRGFLFQLLKAAARSAINEAGFTSLQENQRVSFDVTTGPKGKQAANIQAA